MATLEELKPVIKMGYPVYNHTFNMIVQPDGRGAYCVINPTVRMGHIGIDLDKAIRIANESRQNHPEWELSSICVLIQPYLPSKQGGTQ